MDEFKFVLKCLVISCVIVIFSQTKIAGETLENKASIYFKYSDTAQWVRAAADGGVKLIRQGADKTQNFISEKFGNGSSSSGRSYISSDSSQQARNTGIFRKLERKEQVQPRGNSAEPENDENNLNIEE